MVRRILRFAWETLRPQMWALTLCGVTGLLSLVVVYLIVWPAYQNPIARMYTSKLGYSSVIRKTGGAFPVQIQTVEKRSIVGKFIGEGLVQSEPVQVPMIAMARILKVNVTEGQRVSAGDVITELDPSRLELKIQSARAALQTARSELERVRLGTVNVLQEERPDVLALRAQAAAAEAAVTDKVLRMHQSLNEDKVISRADFARSELDAIRAELEKRELAIAAETARKGRVSSVSIAQSAIREAELTLAHRLNEKRDYVSRCPVDGIVERVLVHAGEYNQDPGRPAVLLACGLWFECYLDQTAFGRVRVGDQVEVRLSAYQDQIFSGSIERVRPLVNFSLGGPETNRPIRPLGTGAPEWPSTFTVRVHFDEPGDQVVPGMTGYATVLQRRDTLSVPRGTVSALSGKRGIVFVVDENGDTFQPRNVVTGVSDGKWVEIREGLREGERVITDGYQVLEPGDRVSPDIEGDSVNVRLVGTNDSDPNAPAATEADDDGPRS